MQFVYSCSRRIGTTYATAGGVQQQAHKINSIQVYNLISWHQANTNKSNSIDNWFKCFFIQIQAAINLENDLIKAATVIIEKVYNVINYSTPSANSPKFNILLFGPMFKKVKCFLF